jgi:hypothetical protein
MRLRLPKITRTEAKAFLALARTASTLAEAAHYHRLAVNAEKAKS